MISQQQLHIILRVFGQSNTSILDLLCTLVRTLTEFSELTNLVCTHREVFCHPDNLNNLFSVLISTPDISKTVSILARNATVHSYLGN